MIYDRYDMIYDMIRYMIDKIYDMIGTIWYDIW